MIEKSARFRVIHLAKISLARMTERRVADIVTERNSLDKIKVKTENIANRTRNSRNELNVQRPSRYIVVLIERENLRFIRLSVVIRAVKDLINVSRIRGAPNRFLILRFIATYSVCADRGKSRAISALKVALYALIHLF